MKKKMKSRPPRKTFAERLAEKLRPLGDVEYDAFGDNSGSWVALRIGNKLLSISFDMKGEKIDRVGVWEDVLGVVDTKQIFGK